MSHRFMIIDAHPEFRTLLPEHAALLAAMQEGASVTDLTLDDLVA